jgi:hypothetical protein
MSFRAKADVRPEARDFAQAALRTPHSAGGLRWTPDEKALFANLYAHREVTGSSVSVRRRDFDYPGLGRACKRCGRARPTLLLAQLVEKGYTTADMASRLSNAFGQGYTPRYTLRTQTGTPAGCNGQALRVHPCKRPRSIVAARCGRPAHQAPRRKA